MKKLHILYILLLLSILATSQLQAQNAGNYDLPTPTIRVKVGIQKDKIFLRWAVDEPVAWQKANKIGFVVKRYTYMRDGKLLPESEEKHLGIFLPKPEKDWEEIVETNDNAAIVAQSLYGEDFEVEMGNQPQGLEGIVNKSQEIEQRFAFALMAADLDYDVAVLAGWAYTDTDVKENEKYLYTVELSPTNNANNLIIEQGKAVASLNDREDLPSPLGFIGIYQDKTVTLAWEYLQLRDTYTAYFIEKSEDGTTFTSLGDLPVMNMNDKPDRPATGMIYVDSLAQNDQNYSYRIRGKTIFGEYGPYSDIVSGRGKKTLETTPRIKSFDIAQDNETITINWEFLQEAEKDINSFELLHSETDEKGSYKVIKDKIPVKDRSLITKSISPSNYFKISALGKNNDHRESFAALVQPDDNTPPAIPIELKGMIDSTGVVRLTWKPNTEKDFAGYHVFRGIREGEELVRLTAQAIEIPQYIDSVQLENLNSKVYYYVTAIDHRKNQSESSKIVELDKPDKLRPEAPAFINYKTEDGMIQLSWTKSYSEDVVIHKLYRQALDDPDRRWLVVYESKDIKSTYEYADKNVIDDHRYKYYLLAVDKNGLISDKSQEITLRNIDLRPVDVIKTLAGFANKDKNMIEINWSLAPLEKVAEIIVYRQKEGDKATLWGTFSGGQNFLEDKDVQVGEKYTYLLKAMLKDNRPTTTQKITVDY
ncbi:hypothetical protein FACS1894169_04720 [Bacteroidia bacterium]|nr:hypothetical protein FACS1894169_04720 [Bacteroidia bacterium]